MRSNNLYTKYIFKYGRIINVKILITADGGSIYDIEFINNEKIENTNNNNIIRLMTLEEIEEFEIKINSIKYNL